MELLGPRPKPNRRHIGLNEFESGPPNIGASGGNGWEVTRTQAGEVEYTMTLSDSNSPSLVLSQLPQSVRNGQTITFFRLAYVTKAATGGTFRIGKSGPIPYNCTADELITQLNLDPALSGFTAVGGPLHTDEIQLCGAFGLNKLDGYLIDSTDLLPGAQITAHVGTDKLKAITHHGDPNQIVDIGEGLAAIFGGLSTSLIVTGISRTSVVGVFEGGNYYSQVDVTFTLAYKSYPCRLNTGNFKLQSTVSGGLSAKLSSSGITGLWGRFNVVCATAEIPYNADGAAILSALAAGINLGSTSVQTMAYEGGGQPNIPINGAKLFDCDLAGSTYSSGRIDLNAITFTVRLKSVPVSVPWVGVNPGTLNGVSSLTPADAMAAQPDSRRLNDARVEIYDYELNLKSTQHLGLNCLRLAKGSSGYKAVCVSENSQQILQNTGNAIVGYNPRYGDGNSPILPPTGARLPVGKLITIHQDYGYYGNEPFLAKWNLRSTTSPYGFAVVTNEYNTAWLVTEPQFPGYTIYGIDLRSIPIGRYTFQEDNVQVIGDGVIRFWSLYLNFYMDPVYGTVTQPGQVAPLYVYRAYDSNFNVTFEKQLNIPTTIGLSTPFDTMFTPPCKGLPAVAPLAKFSDGTFGYFGPNIVSGAVGNMYVRYTDADAVQFTKGLYTNPDPCFTAFDLPAISHVDSGDNIIAVADRFLPDNSISPNGVVYVFDKNMHKLRTIQLKGQAVACASDSQKNIYVVTTTDRQVGISEFRVTAWKYAFDGTLLGSIVLANSKFSDMLKSIETSVGPSPLAATFNWIATPPTYFNRYLRAACNENTFFVYGAGMKWSMTL